MTNEGGENKATQNTQWPTYCSEARTIGGVQKSQHCPSVHCCPRLKVKGQSDIWLMTLQYTSNFNDIEQEVVNPGSGRIASSGLDLLAVGTGDFQWCNWDTVTS